MSDFKKLFENQNLEIVELENIFMLIENNDLGRQ